MNNVVLPELGEGIEKAVVACWHYRPGDRVAAGDEVVEVVTDKAVFCVPADVSGTLKEIFVEEGGEAAIGGNLFSIEQRARPN